jgi:hypothetical protein
LFFCSYYRYQRVDRNHRRARARAGVRRGKKRLDGVRMESGHSGDGGNFAPPRRTGSSRSTRPSQLGDTRFSLRPPLIPSSSLSSDHSLSLTHHEGCSPFALRPVPFLATRRARSRPPRLALSRRQRRTPAAPPRLAHPSHSLTSKHSGRGSQPKSSRRYTRSSRKSRRRTGSRSLLTRRKPVRHLRIPPTFSPRIQCSHYLLSPISFLSHAPSTLGYTNSCVDAHTNSRPFRTSDQRRSDPNVLFRIAYYVAFGPHGPRAPVHPAGAVPKILVGIVASVAATGVLFWAVRASGKLIKRS